MSVVVVCVVVVVVVQVLMKDITTPVPAEEMKKLVQKCLENAAQINYSQLMEYAQITGQTLRYIKST